MNLRQSKTVFALSALACAMSAATVTAATLPAGKVVTSKQAEVQGRTYQFEKVSDERGQIVERISSGGRAVSVVPAGKREQVESKLAEVLARAADTDVIEVNIALRDEGKALPVSMEDGGVEFVDGKAANQRLNGRAVKDSDLQALNAREDLRARSHERAHGQRGGRPSWFVGAW